MYVPPHFREIRATVIDELIGRNPFGMLVTTSSDGHSEVSHLALTYVRDDAEKLFGTVVGHLASANDQCDSVRSRGRATVIFQGPSHYVSPRFYNTVPSPPTWNYCAVHLHGSLRPRPSSEDADRVLDVLTTVLEDGFSPPFRYASLSPEYTATRKPGILAFTMSVDSVDAQFKMSQNRTLKDRLGVINGLRELADHNALAVADIMEELLQRDHPEEFSR